MCEGEEIPYMSHTLCLLYIPFSCTKEWHVLILHCQACAFHPCLPIRSTFQFIPPFSLFSSPHESSKARARDRARGTHQNPPLFPVWHTTSSQLSLTPCFNSKCRKSRLGSPRSWSGSTAMGAFRRSRRPSMASMVFPSSFLFFFYFFIIWLLILISFLQGIRDLQVELPQQKLTIICWADPEKVVKAIKKTRKNATISYSEPPPETAPAPDPTGQEQPPPPHSPNPPPTEAPASNSSPPPMENPQPDTTGSPPSAACDATEEPSPQPTGPGQTEQVHEIHHHPPYSDYGGPWSNYPGAAAYRQEPGLHPEPPLPQPIYVTHSYNTYRPSPHATYAQSYRTYQPPSYVSQYECVGPQQPQAPRYLREHEYTRPQFMSSPPPPPPSQPLAYAAEHEHIRPRPKPSPPPQPPACVREHEHAQTQPKPSPPPPPPPPPPTPSPPLSQPPAYVREHEHVRPQPSPSTPPAQHSPGYAVGHEYIRPLSPSTFVSEYEYYRPPPVYMRYDYEGSNNGNSSIGSMFSDENPNACRIV
ncbi:hypothetical protein NMG60_11031567 [Bertholletia excelsa]